jgi:flagellar hook-associated protein 3 FlgL
MTRIATLSQQQALLNELLKTNARTFQTQLQVSTGKVGQTYKDLAKDTGVLLSAKRVETRITQFQKTVGELGGRLDNQNVQLEQIASSAGQLRQNVLDALSLNSGSGLMEAVDGVFRQALSVLNAQVDGSYIFAGSRVDNSPVNITSLADLVAAPAASGIFTNDQQRRGVEIDTGQTLNYTFLADEIGEPLMTALKDIADYNAGPNGPFGDQLTAQQQQFLQNILPTLKTVSQDLNNVVARNGQYQQEVANVTDVHEQTSVFIKGFISDIEDVDMADAVSRLNQDQVASQAATYILSQLQNISLLNFLPSN